MDTEVLEQWISALVNDRGMIHCEALGRHFRRNKDLRAKLPRIVERAVTNFEANKTKNLAQWPTWRRNARVLTELLFEARAITDWKACLRRLEDQLAPCIDCDDALVEKLGRDVLKARNDLLPSTAVYVEHIFAALSRYPLWQSKVVRHVLGHASFPYVDIDKEKAFEVRVGWPPKGPTLHEEACRAWRRSVDLTRLIDDRWLTEDLAWVRARCWLLDDKQDYYDALFQAFHVALKLSKTVHDAGVKVQRLKEQLPAVPKQAIMASFSSLLESLPWTTEDAVEAALTNSDIVLHVLEYIDYGYAAARVCFCKRLAHEPIDEDVVEVFRKQWTRYGIPEFEQISADFRIVSQFHAVRYLSAIPLVPCVQRDAEAYLDKFPNRRLSSSALLSTCEVRWESRLIFVCAAQYHVLEQFNAIDTLPRTSVDLDPRLLDNLLGPNRPLRLSPDSACVTYASPAGGCETMTGAERLNGCARFFNSTMLLDATRETLAEPCRPQLDPAWVDAAMVYCLKHCFGKTFEELAEHMSELRGSEAPQDLLRSRIDNLMARGLLRQDDTLFKYKP